MPRSPERSLAAALRADPAASLPAATITAVLAAIGFDDPAAATSVSADGRWRNGPLRGRHVAARARHIGAAARAAHRQERIAQIDAELAALAEQALLRDRQRAALDDDRGGTGQRWSAPRRAPPTCSRPAGSRPRARPGPAAVPPAPPGRPGGPGRRGSPGPAN